MDQLDVVIDTYNQAGNLEGKETRRQLTLDCQRFVVNHPGVPGCLRRLDQLAWKFMVRGGGAAHFTRPACQWDNYDHQYKILQCVQAIMALYDNGGVLSQNPPADVAEDVCVAATRMATQRQVDPLQQSGGEFPTGVCAKPQLVLQELALSRTDLEKCRANTLKKKVDLPSLPSGDKSPNTVSPAAPSPRAQTLPLRFSPCRPRETAPRVTTCVVDWGSAIENTHAELRALRTELHTWAPSQRKAAREEAKQGTTKKLAKTPDVEVKIEPGTSRDTGGRRSSNNKNITWDTWDNCSVDSPYSTE
ncbi:hypothetical protein Z517_05051 [Fonsecaea pedrosoi CBS 271.37]|uniref:Unplaced genomic scaffold supercont1.3, whole genome shotgun sequence n=1 Tax=Fonsecaea pedrosoi CBS 271.37 TaxID=1442368 RepID=A0A0D2HBY5_9EURO|nr:uncharacterized protein Z517_05051 [Fonsecaea pedrosoi CBS 271.37]KIW82024.1 hypothetical protein Z517_05051 [Fonsecaea pedrosoi CBS 271.37]